MTLGADPVDLRFSGELSAATEEPALTPQQKLAVLIAGALAVVLLLSVAISLLPPAPDLSSMR